MAGEQLVQFAIFLIAVRVLTPAEFGTFALAAAVIALLRLMSVAGWPEYIMSCKGSSRRPRQALFAAMSCGALCALAGLLLSIAAQAAFNGPDTGALIRALSAAIFFNAIAAAQSGILNWQGRLSAAVLPPLFAELANLAVAGWALLHGHGVMGLAYGRLASAVLWAASASLLSRSLPLAVIQRATLLAMAGFAWQVMLTRLLAAARLYAATFIIGAFLGAAPVGYYRAAQRVIAAFGEIASEPARILAWSMFRTARDRDGGAEGFDTVAQRFFTVLAYGAAGLFLIAALLAPQIAAALFGPGWEATVPLMQILAVAAALRTTAHTLTPILSLAGKVRWMPRLMLIYGLISIAAVSAAAPFGMIPTACAEAAAAAIIFGLNAKVMQMAAEIRWPAILWRARGVLPAAAAAALAVVFLQGAAAGWPALGQVLLLAPAAAAAYAAVLLALDGDFRRLLKTAVRSTEAAPGPGE